MVSKYLNPPGNTLKVRRICRKMNSTDTKGNRAVDVAFVGAYSLLFVVGLPLNLIALWIFFRGALRSITIIYMKNLAVSDLLLLASLPLRAYYYGQKPQLSPGVCEMAGLILLFNMYSSIFLLTCISWDRCMAVCFPLHTWARAFRQKSRYICAGVWAMSFLGTIPYFTGKMENRNDTLCFDYRPRYIMEPRISGAMVLSFALPLVIMVTCSCSLLRAVHQSSVVLMKLVNGAKIQHMVATNLAIFLGCFLPYHLVVLCYQVKELDTDHQDMAYRWALLLACANATLDPLAYYFATETFQNLVTIEHLFLGQGTHAHHAGGSEQLSLSQGAQRQPTLPTPAFEALSCIEAPDLKEASASGPAQF
ncbi:lysophosphatidic acid receptor 6-like isoform X2 [Paroedura picta]